MDELTNDFRLVVAHYVECPRSGCPLANSGHAPGQPPISSRPKWDIYNQLTDLPSHKVPRGTRDELYQIWKWKRKPT